MKDLSLDHLRSFADVVELGSFSAAAERAGLTQPAVSLKIRDLERRLGVRLIERVGRRAQPTAAGRDLLVHARRIHAEIDEAVASIAPHRSGAVGRVRIGTGATACIHLLPPILTALRRRLPGLDIVVCTGNTLDLLKRLEANDLDVLLGTMPMSGRAFDITKVGDDELVAVYPAAKPPPARPLTARFLAEQPLLLYEEGGHTRRLIERWFVAGGAVAKPVMELGSVEAIKQLVGVGLGWAVLPRLSLSGRGGPRLGWRSLSPKLTRTLGLVPPRQAPDARPARRRRGAARGGAALSCHVVAV
jgi:DNA-binding transcriptional LysR family regulator